KKQQVLLGEEPAAGYSQATSPLARMGDGAPTKASSRMVSTFGDTPCSSPSEGHGVLSNEILPNYHPEPRPVRNHHHGAVDLEAFDPHRLQELDAVQLGGQQRVHRAEVVDAGGEA